ncbi:MAG: caspase family protein [Phycisphaerae bacterium]|nr:caspase family protein [Saprospiraceae bacterium]
MKALFYFFTALLLSLSASAQRSGKDYAVFFVASKFDHNWTDLPYSLDEVNKIAAELRDQYGFEVRIVSDARRADIFRTLSEYKKKTYGTNDQLLVYFTMHGYHDPGSDKGYLIPKDGLYDDPIFESWLSHSTLAEIASSMPCRRVMVSLDACYSGIFGGNMDKPTAAAWENGNACDAKLASAFKGEAKTRKYTAAGGDVRVPKKSEFAIQWLRALKIGAGEDGLLSFSELVATLDQFKDPRPTWGDFDRSTTGDFVFVRKNGCATTTTASKTKAQGDRAYEALAWSEAYTANTCKAFQEYKTNYCPNGIFCKQADEEIAKLKCASLVAGNKFIGTWIKYSGAGPDTIIIDQFIFTPDNAYSVQMSGHDTFNGIFKQDLLLKQNLTNFTSNKRRSMRTGHEGSLETVFVTKTLKIIDDAMIYSKKEGLIETTQSTYKKL